MKREQITFKAYLEYHSRNRLNTLTGPWRIVIDKPQCPNKVDELEAIRPLKSWMLDGLVATSISASPAGIV